jgi:hypothetical protein
MDFRVHIFCQMKPCELQINDENFDAFDNDYSKY